MLIYLLLTIPPLLFGFYAQWRVKSSFEKWSQFAASCNLTGAEAAAYMLRSAGLQNVRIERTEGFLSDHYDPSEKMLRLSPAVHDGYSVAALGVACHEAGHAIQDAKKYAPLVIRSVAVPSAQFGSWLAFPLILLGLFLNLTGLAVVGLVAFTAVVAFQLITLPVEFDASNRAKKALADLRMTRPGKETEGVNAVLDAAAMTYVAAAVAGIGQLIYYALLVFGGGQRRSE